MMPGNEKFHPTKAFFEILLDNRTIVLDATMHKLRRAQTTMYTTAATFIKHEAQSTYTGTKPVKEKSWLGRFRHLVDIHGLG